ncbi:hypothetical protein VPH35_043160 [Triticum aestivum]
MSFIVHVDMNNGCLLSECVQVPKFIAHRGLVFLSFWDDNLGVYISIIPLFLSFWDDNLGVYISIIPYHFCEDVVLLRVCQKSTQIVRVCGHTQHSVDTAGFSFPCGFGR